MIHANLIQSLKIDIAWEASWSVRGSHLDWLGLNPTPTAIILRLYSYLASNCIVGAFGQKPPSPLLTCLHQHKQQNQWTVVLHYNLCFKSCAMWIIHLLQLLIHCQSVQMFFSLFCVFFFFSTSFFFLPAFSVFTVAALLVHHPLACFLLLKLILQLLPLQVVSS